MEHPATSKVASLDQQNFWRALGSLPTPLYLIVGTTDVRAELLGSLSLAKSNGEDVIILNGTSNHAHINWAAISRIQHNPRDDGYDRITFFGGRDGEVRLLEIVPESPSYRFPETLLAALPS